MSKFVTNTTPGRIARAKDDQKLPCNIGMFGFDIVDVKRVVNQAQAAAIRQAVEVTLKEGRPGAGKRWLNDHDWHTTQGKPFSTQTLICKGGFLNSLIRDSTWELTLATLMKRLDDKIK